MEIDEQNDPLGPRGNQTGHRASDKGFLPISDEEYIEVLDWTARQVASGKRDSTPLNTPPIFERLQLSSEQWCRLVSRFDKLFHHVAGKPTIVESTRGRHKHRPFRVTREASQLLTTSG